MSFTLRGIPIGVWSEANTLDKVCARVALASIYVKFLSDASSCPEDPFRIS